MGRLRHHKQQGFTLVELLITVLIIGLLAAIAIPVFNGQRAKAYDARTISNLTNAVRTFKDVYLPRDAYNQAGLDEAAVNETALNISNVELSTLPEAEAYKENIIQARMFTGDPHTVVLTQKSRSGKDFCLATREMAPFAGVVRSWTITPDNPGPGSLSGLAGLCPSTQTLATLGGTYDQEINLNALVPGGEDDDGGSGGGGSEEPEAYGDYFDIRAALSPNVTCGFDDNGTNNSTNPLNCNGGANGQYANHNNTEYELRQTGGIMGLDDDDAIEPITDNYSARFKGNNRNTYINGNYPIGNGSASNHRPWAIEVWIKPETNNATQGVMGDPSIWTMKLDGGKVNFAVLQSEHPYGLRSISGNQDLAHNEWNQIIATFNNGTLSLYVNGVIDGTIENMLGLTSTSSPSIGFGSVRGDSINPFNGYIDEFSYYNKQLTAEEIKSLYESGTQTAIAE